MEENRFFWKRKETFQNLIPVYDARSEDHGCQGKFKFDISTRGWVDDTFITIDAKIVGIKEQTVIARMFKFWFRKASLTE